MPSTEYDTTRQVTLYYGVDECVIKKQVSLNRDEIMADGVKNLSGVKTKEFLVSENISPSNFKGYFEAGNQKFSYNSNILFPKRAILRIEMLLRDSEIAKLNLYILIEYEKNSKRIVENF